VGPRVVDGEGSVQTRQRRREKAENDLVAFFSGGRKNGKGVRKKGPTTTTWDIKGVVHRRRGRSISDSGRAPPILNTKKSTKLKEITPAPISIRKEKSRKTGKPDMKKKKSTGPLRRVKNEEAAMTEKVCGRKTRLEEKKRRFRISTMEVAR